jgi:hypothetical protein
MISVSGIGAYPGFAAASIELKTYGSILAAMHERA